jgi:endonuclease/exonuclease/phosphatase family metal-dependent hydrolase
VFEKTFAHLRGDHPEPIQRGALSGVFSTHGERFRVTNVHLDWHGGAGHRIKQRKYLAQHLKLNAFTGGEIVCGDFNFLGPFSTTAAEHFRDQLGQEFVNSISTFQFTTTFFQHLDHIFVKHLELDGAEVHKLPGSDHYPLSARLRIK